MEAFYEESSIAGNKTTPSKKYTVLNVFSVIFLVFGIINVIIFVLRIPILADMLLLGSTALMFLGLWFVLRKMKMNTNVSYDYCFVSGELRISRVININRRRLVAKFETDDIIQIGDMDSPSFDRFYADPTIKKVYCTANAEAGEGKFFMYILANYNGKQLFLLECRENLLMNIMKFAKRTTLDSNYVMQEKKQKKV